MPKGSAFRALLRFYPRDYRRQRGREVIDTFLEAGRARPSVREALNLACHGMRARLGRPASRGVVIWAWLFSVMCSLFVASACVRLAWETARPFADRDEATRVVGVAFPDRGIERFDRSPAMFTVYGEPLSLSNYHSLFFSDGDGYWFGKT